ncbi:heterokaryon incompatibility protein-domain-containing protein [Dactylonectria macrodidyma]|uniref:Heterokaryon incompatibility protein-domain-containing protein n=1 Tax=Dactylonectria macrodidyma TaxID=307937 RepID=A0A9P9EF96_9HYPO|nr:heterokaryon incompatibility protein-domain-containing protein [Dactylonectria macrodidyma]
MSQIKAEIAVTGQAVEKLCQRCLHLSFDNSAIIDAAPPQKYLGRDDVDLDDYGIVPLNFTLDDVLPGLPKLGRSIAAGCRMCFFLKRVILAQPSSTSTSRSSTKSLHLRFTAFHPDLGTVQFAKGRGDWLPHRIEGELRIGSTSRSISIHAKHRTDDPNPLSDQSIQRMKTYLNTCIQNHDMQHSECVYPGQIAAPLRLLNISDSKVVRLEETDGKNLQYVILSYCWGPSRLVFDARTVMANLPGRLIGFATDTLPQTLQDSIALARRLEASHIWIDALCIVQDSGEWIQESQRMMQYYEMALFTIVPIDSSGAELGFLRNRPEWVSDVIAWQGSWSHLQFYFPSFRGVEEIGGATSSPWASRGWTFQERLLSSRLVFIGHDEVVFRCRAGYGNHSSQPPIKLESLGSYFLPMSPAHAAKSPDWNSVEMIRDKWYQLVSEYSQRSLTQQSDKLIALSGVESKTKQLLGSHERYLDGLWESDLWHGLTWRRVPVRGVSAWPTIKSSDFPSWSWCCMNQPLVWQDGTASVSDAKLVEIVREGTSPNAKAKMIVLESWVFSIQMLATQLPKEIEVDFYLDGLSVSPADLFKLNSVRVVLVQAYLDGDDKGAWTRNPAGKPHDACGLIIEPTGESYGGHEVYQRLGVVDILLGLEFAPLSAEEYWAFLYQEMYSRKEVIVLA